MSQEAAHPLACDDVKWARAQLEDPPPPSLLPPSPTFTPQLIALKTFPLHALLSCGQDHGPILLSAVHGQDSACAQSGTATVLLTPSPKWASACVSLIGRRLRQRGPFRPDTLWVQACRSGTSRLAHMTVIKRRRTSERLSHGFFLQRSSTRWTLPAHVIQVAGCSVVSSLSLSLSRFPLSLFLLLAVSASVSDASVRCDKAGTLFVFRRKLASVSVRVVLVTADQREWRFVG